MSAIRSTWPLAMLLAAPGPAGAAELKVGGRIVPTPCAVVLSGHGQVNFGTIDTSALKQDYSTPLRARQVTLSIDCTQSSNVALKLSDARAGSMIAGLVNPSTSDQEAFGLGMSGQARIGNYYLRMPREGLYIDDRPAALLYSVDGNRSWKRTGPAGELRRDYSFAWGRRQDRLPSMFKHLRATLNVTPYIARTTDLPIDQDIVLDGLANVELQYF